MTAEREKKEIGVDGTDIFRMGYGMGLTLSASEKNRVVAYFLAFVLDIPQNQAKHDCPELIRYSYPAVHKKGDFGSFWNLLIKEFPDHIPQNAPRRFVSRFLPRKSLRLESNLSHCREFILGLHEGQVSEERLKGKGLSIPEEDPEKSTPLENLATLLFNSP